MSLDHAAELASLQAEELRLQQAARALRERKIALLKAAAEKVAVAEAANAAAINAWGFARLRRQNCAKEAEAAVKVLQEKEQHLSAKVKALEKAQQEHDDAKEEKAAAAERAEALTAEKEVSDRHPRHAVLAATAPLRPP